MCAVGAIDAAGAVTLLYAGLNFQHRGLEAEVLREMEEFATVGRSIAREEIKIPGSGCSIQRQRVRRSSRL